jgi:tetratricopeptide (TPR) repeat protein
MQRRSAALLVVLAASVPPAAAAPWESYPLRARQRYDRGWALYAAANYRYALEAFEDAIELGLEHPELYLRRAYCHLRLGNADLAVRQLGRFLRDFPIGKSCPDCVRWAHAGRAAAHEARGDHALALADHAVVVSLLGQRITLLEGDGKPVPLGLLRAAGEAHRARARCLRNLPGRDVELLEDARADDCRARVLAAAAEAVSRQQRANRRETKKEARNEEGIRERARTHGRWEE